MMVFFTQWAGGSAFKGLESLIKSLITGAWTAIEVLAEMLWTRTHEEKTSFPILTKTEQGKIGFRSRSKIRFSFLTSYGNDPDIMRSLNNHAVDALALLRNAIVHNAGLVDKEFRKGMESQSNPPSPYLDRYIGLGDGSPILLDGDVVRSIIDSSFVSGYDLIDSVDKWMTANP